MLVKASITVTAPRDRDAPFTGRISRKIDHNSSKSNLNPKAFRMFKSALLLGLGLLVTGVRRSSLIHT